MDQRASTHFEEKDNDMVKHTMDFLDKILELEVEYEEVPRKYAEEKTRIVRDLNMIFNASLEERERMLEEQYDILEKEIEAIKNNLKLTEDEKEAKYKEIYRRLDEITYEIDELPNKSQKEQDKYLEDTLYEMVDVAIEVDQRLVEKKLKELVQKRVALLNYLYTIKGYKQEMIYEALKVMAEFRFNNEKLNEIYGKAFSEALLKNPVLENVYISYSEKNVEINFEVYKRVINVGALGDDFEFQDATLRQNNAKIKGDVEAVKSVNKIEAIVDLTKLINLTDGANQLENVELIALDKDGNMLNVEIEPKTISASVMLKALQKADIQKPVEAELINSDIISEENKLNVTLSPNSVKVKGDLASRVVSVKAPIDVSEIGDPTVGEHNLNGINLVAYDVDGNPVDADLEPPTVDATLTISKKIERPTDIEKNPKKTWQTWLALAAGIGVGAAVAFGVGPIGVSVMTIAGGLANKFVNKKRQQLRAQRLRGTLPVEEVIESNGLKGKFEQLKRYMKSERGLRDLSWFLNGAIYSGLGFSAAQAIYGLVANSIGANLNTGDTGNVDTVDTNTDNINTNSDNIEPYGPEPAPTDDIVLGEQVGNSDLSVGHDSAIEAFSGQNAESLIPEYVNSESVFNRFAIMNDDGKIAQIIDAPGTSLNEFCNSNGIDPSSVVVDVSKDGVSQAWITAQQLLNKLGGKSL